MIQNNEKTVEVMSEGRLFKRFVKEGAISITFRGQTTTGSLVNLSVSGLLANFPSNDPLPGMAEKIEIRLEVGGKGNVLDVQGTIVRIQVPKDYEQQDLIEIAMNFGELSPSARYSLQKLIKYLLVKTTGYKA
jgi:hypothetical protein